MKCPKDKILNVNETKCIKKSRKYILKEIFNNLLNKYPTIENEIFNFMLVYSGQRKALLYEPLNNVFNDIWLEFRKDIIKLIKNKNISYINKIDKANRFLLFNKTKNICNLVNKYKHTKSDSVLGKILEFNCPGLPTQGESIVIQKIFVNNIEFFTQICKEEKYNKVSEKFEKQLQKYKQIGDILNVSIRMSIEYQKGSSDIKKYLRTINTQKIIENKETISNYISNIRKYENNMLISENLLMNGSDTDIKQNIKKIIIIANIALDDPFSILYPVNSQSTLDEIDNIIRNFEKELYRSNI